MEKIIRIVDKEYRVLDSLPEITIADSFVMPSNKIMTGNGEAKLYLGQESIKFRSFFGSHPFQIDCFMLSVDWRDYMLKAKDEYLNPSQNYRRKDKFDHLYTNRQTKVNFLPQKMNFILIEQKINPPRIYVKSISPYYKLIREISLPNFSKFSISKLLYGNKVIYYFKIFYKKKLTQLPFE